MKHRWPIQSLGEVCDAKSGNSKIIKGTLPHQNDGSLFPAYSATGQDVFSDGYDFDCDGIVISAVGARCGKCFLATGKWRAIANTHVIIPRRDKSNVRFLWYLLNDESFWIRGGTAQPFVKVGDSMKTKIAVPPLAEQERIVKLLDEADELRKLRAQADRRTAALIPALFHDMFGVPFANSLPYPLKKLGEMIRQDDKINYGVVQPGGEVADGIPFVRAGDFNGMAVAQQNLKRISPQIENNYRRSRLRGDEILISCVGSIGDIALADPSLEGFNIARAVARVPLRDEFNRVFVAIQLLTPELQSFFRQETRTVAQPTLNIRQIEETPIILPPLPLQKEFAARVADIRTMEAAQAASRRRLDDLFQSLLHRAFNGEL